MALSPRRRERRFHGGAPILPEASTAQGNIGIKVWVNNGDYLSEETTDTQAPSPARRRRRGPRRDGDGQGGGQG